MTRTTSAAARAAIIEHLPAIAIAWSVNGRDVRFQTGFDLAVEPAGFVTVTTGDGARYLVQVHELVAANRQGIEVELVGEELGVADAGVGRATVELTTRVIEGHGQIVRRLDGSGAAPAAFTEAELAVADAADVRDHLEASTGSRGIEVGAVRGGDIPGRLRPQGFARHTFMCGQSGSGKTFSLGVVLERLLLETDLPVVIVDPNSDYVNLGRLTSLDAINRFRSTPMSRREYAALRARFAERADVLVASARDGDVPLSIHLSDLTRSEQALAMQLDPIVDAVEYTALVEAAGALGDGPYDLADLAAVLNHRFDDASRALARRIANLDLASWSVWAASSEPSLVDRVAGRRAVVLDTGSLAHAHERSVIALALLGRLRRRPQRAPISVVIDEAHNVCPPDAVTALDRAVTDLTLWIAGEGRKYGIYLLLSTQRPQKIHRNVISQCDNLLLMRVNSVGDLDELAHVFSHVPSGLIQEARSHRMGELLAAGPIAPTPMRVQVGVRWTEEGGADLPTDWATPSS